MNRRLYGGLPSASTNKILQRTGKSVVQAICIALSLCGAAHADHAKTNVVLILIDDLGWKDLGCYGSDYYPDAYTSTDWPKKACGSPMAMPPAMSAHPHEQQS